MKSKEIFNELFLKVRDAKVYGKPVGKNSVSIKIRESKLQGEILGFGLT